MTDHPRLRVLLVYRPIERALMLMVADHLARIGFDIVLDVPRVRGGLTDTLDQVQFADRVVTTWQRGADTAGGIIFIADRAAKAAKAVGIHFDESENPLSSKFPSVDFSRFDGRSGSSEIVRLAALLRTEPSAPVLDSSVRSLLENAHAMPAEPYRVDYSKPPISGPAFSPADDPAVLTQISSEPFGGSRSI